MTSIFDIIGPIMIGPSSSHTAGAARIGRLAWRLLQEPVRKAEIVLYGSFARTYLGHGTHLALLGGLLGFAPDDPRIRDAEALARDSFTYTMKQGGEAEHPNTVRLKLYGNQAQVEVVGISVGGGSIRLIEIDGFPVRIDGESIVAIVHSLDRPGVITQLTSVVAMDGVNVGNMHVSRQGRGASVVMTIEVDSELSPSAMASMSTIPGVRRITQIIP